MVILQSDSSKNHIQGEAPKCIYPNTRAPGNIDGCLCVALIVYAMIPRSQPMAANEHMLKGVTATAMRKVIKLIATRVGLDPARCHIRCLRIGCCSATTPEVLDIATALAQG